MSYLKENFYITHGKRTTIVRSSKGEEHIQKMNYYENQYSLRRSKNKQGNSDPRGVSTVINFNCYVNLFYENNFNFDQIHTNFDNLIVYNDGVS